MSADCRDVTHKPHAHCREALVQNFNNRMMYLEIDLEHLKDYDSELHDIVLKRPNEYIPMVRNVAALDVASPIAFGCMALCWDVCEGVCLSGSPRSNRASVHCGCMHCAVPSLRLLCLYGVALHVSPSLSLSPSVSCLQLELGTRDALITLVGETTAEGGVVPSVQVLFVGDMAPTPIRAITVSRQTNQPTMFSRIESSTQPRVHKWLDSDACVQTLLLPSMHRKL